MEERKIEVLPEAESVSRVSWGSVIAGTVVALIVQFTLIVLGLAVGLAMIEPATEENPMGAIGTGTALWWIVSSIIAFFVGGWVASRLAGLQRVFDGALHGIITWGLVTLLTLYLLSSTVGLVLGGAFGVVRNVIQASGQAVSAMLPQIAGGVTGQPGTAGPVQQELQQLLQQRGRPGAAQDQNVISDLNNAIQGLMQGGVSETDRQRVVSLLTQHTTMSQQEAQGFVQQIETTRQEAQQQIAQAQESAREIGGDVADALTAAA
ncbi:MAG TPA: hypothetical protein PKM59_09375, partial [Thermodesulfobacteriota bacterium]|nr:hypothetical protein [Thermodesulfobacteriota bacterium]